MTETDAIDTDAVDVRTMVADAMATEMRTRRSLSQLANSVSEDCARIESNQRAWIAGGLNMRPDPVMIAKLADFQQIYDFLEACRTRPGDVVRRLSDRRSAE